MFVYNHYRSSSSCMHVMNHNWSATKQHLHPQSVAEISRHSVLSGDRIWQCETSFGSRHKDRSVSVSRHFLLQAPHCPWSMRKRFSRDCCRGRLKPGCQIVGSHARWDRLSRLPVTPPSTFDVNWLQAQSQVLKENFMNQVNYCWTTLRDGCRRWSIVCHGHILKTKQDRPQLLWNTIRKLASLTLLSHTNPPQTLPCGDIRVSNTKYVQILTCKCQFI